MTTANHIDAKTLSDQLRQSFFLKPNSDVSTEMIDAFLTGQKQNNFEALSKLTQPLHTDSFNIHVTHDIDWLNPHHPYSLLNYIRSKVTDHIWFPFGQLIQQNLLLENIEKLIQLEAELNVNAHYFVGASKQKSLSRYGIRYSSNDSLYVQLLALLNSSNQQLGLHSSYGASQKCSIPFEKNLLEQKSNKHITTHRSHYVYYEPLSLYTQLSSSGFTYDFGNGEARTIGLKNGFPGKMKPINPTTGEYLTITTIPLILMDNVFFVKPYHEVMDLFKQTLHKLKQYNGSACILFHPENFVLKPQLWNYFEEIIHICKQEGAALNTRLT